MTLATTAYSDNYGSTPALFAGSAMQQQHFETVTPAEIFAAAIRIKPYIRRTPTLANRGLSQRFASNFYLKLELLQDTGAFKVRGAFNKMLMLSEAEKALGVVAVSGGNHAKAVAYAARTLGIDALILMPDYTPQNYVQETLADGAAVEFHSSLAAAFDQARKYEAAGRTLVHPFDDPAIVAGQATAGIEILEDVPQVTDVIVSVGGGGLSCGVAAAIKASKPEVNVWGVETRGADSMAQALAAGEVVELAEITSIAKTLGAQSVGRLPFKMARTHLKGVTVVEDEEAVSEIFYLLENAKVLTEPATACTIAAAERLKANFGPQSHVVAILCGGNIGLSDLFRLR